MEKTIFQKIAAGEIPAWKIYEDESTLAILDITPVNKGHVLVVPKERFASIYDLPPELFGHMMQVAQKTAKALKASLRAEGVNIIMNNENAGGHITNHAHVHVIPRFANDGHESWEGKNLYVEGEGEIFQQRIKEEI